MNRKILNRLNQMIDKAIEGNFTEKSYDETELAKIETKMARYLATSEGSSRQLQAEKENISELISDISHQMKTPVSNLLIYSELMLEGQETGADPEYVQAIRGQAEKLQFLSEALVKLSRMEAGIIAPMTEMTAVYPMLEKAAAQVQKAAEEKQIAITLEQVDAKVIMDEKWIGEAIFNLLDNAVKYTEVGGRIEVSSVPYEFFYRIDIKDTGVGIPEAEQTNIFGRFYRGYETKKEKGVGIGLYLAREIVNAHGGYIKLQSKLGKGSVFSVFLPLA